MCSRGTLKGQQWTMNRAYSIVGIIRGELIFTVFAVDKHLRKLNQQIIKIVKFFTSYESRRRPYHSHMALLQYFLPHVT